MNDLFRGAELLCWDNEGSEEAAAAAEAAAAKEAEAKQAAEKAAQRTFTQAEVNEFVAERNKNLKKQFEQMEESYGTLLKQQNLTEEQRNRLESDLEAVRTEMMTKEQRLEAEKKRAEEKYTQELQEAVKTADEYRTLFETSTINREIVDSAVKHDAYNPNHFIAHLGPRSKMVDEVDGEGNTTGRKVARVEIDTVDKESGKAQVTLVTMDEAIEKMKENVSEYGCLFKANVAAGIGSGTAPGQASSTGVNPKNLTTAQFMEMAKTPEGRKNLGLSK
jgi:hypothetical protein